METRHQVSLTKTYNFIKSGQTYTGVPIMASNMDTIGTFEMAIALNNHQLFTAIHKHYSTDDWFEFAQKNPQVIGNVAISTGIGEQDQEKLDEILSRVPEINFICIDVANGYMEKFVNYVSATRARYPTKTIMAGNVVTSAMVEALILAGADVVKVGIGPGSVCTTRKKTGVGCPQLSAILDCCEAAHRLGGHIISDGGCTNPGDVCKAFGAGADFVMLGGMLAGHDQCLGEVQTDASGKSYKLFYGMASKLAQQKYNGGLANYRASEGKVVKLPYRGDVSETILDILGGLKSVCTYTGSAGLEALPHNTTFIRVAQQLNEVYTSRELDL